MPAARRGAGALPQPMPRSQQGAARERVLPSSVCSLGHVSGLLWGNAHLLRRSSGLSSKLVQPLLTLMPRPERSGRTGGAKRWWLASRRGLKASKLALGSGRPTAEGPKDVADVPIRRQLVSRRTKKAMCRCIGARADAQSGVAPSIRE